MLRIEEKVQMVQYMDQWSYDLQASRCENRFLTIPLNNPWFRTAAKNQRPLFEDALEINSFTSAFDFTSV